jgi:Na+/serine symporter
VLVRTVAAGALLAAVSACGSSAAAPAPKLVIPANASPQVRLQDEVAQQLSGQGLTVSGVACPADVTPVEASVATCTGVIAGQTLNIQVTFLADNQISVIASA